MTIEEYPNINSLLWQLLHRSYNAIAKLRKKELNQYQITLPQSAVLRVILRLEERATLPNIAKELFLEPNSVSEQLQRMEKDGLIKRTKDLNRNNLLQVEITQDGYNVYLTTLKQQSIDEVMSVLTEDEKSQLWLLLAKLREQSVSKLGIEDLNTFPPFGYINSLH